VPSFAYVAKDGTGQTVEGTRQADNQQVLVRELKAEGYWVTSMKQEKEAAPAAQQKKSSGGFSLFKRVKLGDLAVFCRQFATMINAGVSLVRCLDVLEQQTSSVALKEIIRDIQAEVEGGATLSRAISKYPAVFSNLAVGLIRAGEIGGVLDETLERLAIFLEKDVELRRKIKASMTYPVIVMVVALGIVIFLCSFIVPKFIALFEELGVTEFPMTTMMLKRFSNFLWTPGQPALVNVGRWGLAIGTIIVLRIGMGRLKRTKTGKRYHDALRLKIPVFGALNHKIAIARFSRTLSTLLTSGVPILQAMETVASAIDNDIIGDAVLLSRSAVREGETIGEPLGASRMFPPMVVQMIAIGEETGQLDDMLGKVADFYEAEVDATLQSLTAAIEPGARCRHCGRRFSAQYFFVELSTALLFLAAVLRFGVSLQSFCIMAAGAALIVTFMIDLRHYIILDSCVAIVLATGVLLDAYRLIAGEATFITHQETYGGVHFTVYLPRSLVGIVVGAAAFVGIGWVFNRVFGKLALGEGDTRLAAAVGAWLGPGYAFFGWFLISVVVGAAIGVLAIALGIKKRREYIPFGPMLTGSAIAMMLWGEAITGWIMRFYGTGG